MMYPSDSAFTTKLLKVMAAGDQYSFIEITSRIGEKESSVLDLYYIKQDETKEYNVNL